MKFLFLLPVLGQPRYAKRISMLQVEGVEGKALYFERDYHSGRVPSCRIMKLGKIEHGSYLKRVFVYLKALRKIRKDAKESTVIYAFELDLAVLAYISTLGLKIKRVVEIGDVREVQISPRLAGQFLRVIERKLINRVNLLVVTAPRFYSEYYYKWLGIKTACVVVENKLENQGSPSRTEGDDQDVEWEDIKIGYFGLLRCHWSADVLFRLASQYPEKFSIVLAGKWALPAESLKKLIELENVAFLGEYKSPGGLDELYSKVDIIWACYEPLTSNDLNLHWAKTNRFYESMYFGKPLISRAGSSDGDFVLEKNIGLVLRKDDALQTSLGPISSMNLGDVKAWSENVQAIDSSNYLYTNEAITLLDKLGMSE